MERKDKFISVAMFQLRLDLESNGKEEYLISNANYEKQMHTAIGIIHDKKPDIVVFPEASYSDTFEKDMWEISKHSLVIFGSIYVDGVNNTIIFQNGEKHSIPKRYPSPMEPMIRVCKPLEEVKFIQKYLKEHIFLVKGEKIIILNCMEYYKTAYYIARDSSINDNIFAFVSPCNNSNTEIFTQESMALHNHNEVIYSFVCNTVSIYNGKSYGDGTSYIFGPIQKHEKRWIASDGIESFKHVSSIAKLDNTSAYCIYGDFIRPTYMCWFGRSDSYASSPQNLRITNLI